MGGRKGGRKEGREGGREEGRKEGKKEMFYLNQNNVNLQLVSFVWDNQKVGRKCFI